MRLLELFSGTKSVSKVARELGWQTLSLDICPRHSPDLCMDILLFDETRYPKDYFDMIWASPDCRAYSVARTNAKIPQDEAMAASDKLVAKTLQIVSHFGCAYCIENPATSRLWNRDVAVGLQCVTGSYCCHDYKYRKNTNFASNFLGKLPLCPGPGLCPAMVGRRHIEHAQRGSGGVMPRDHTTDELHTIPEGLVREIFRQLQIFRQLNAGSDPSTAQNGGGVDNP